MTYDDVSRPFARCRSAVETLGFDRFDKTGKDNQTLCEFGQLLVPVVRHGTADWDEPRAPPSPILRAGPSQRVPRRPHAMACVPSQCPVALVDGFMPVYSGPLLMTKSNRPALLRALDMRRTATGMSSA